MDEQKKERGDAAGGFADDVRGAAEYLIDAEKARLADFAHSFANALRRSGDAVADELGAVVARYAADMADKVDRLSDRVRARPWGDLVADLDDGVRRRPEWFLAGAVAAGFLLGRVLAAAPPDGADR